VRNEARVFAIPFPVKNQAGVADIRQAVACASGDSNSVGRPSNRSARHAAKANEGVLQHAH